MKTKINFSSKPDVLVHSQNLLGEGPLWDPSSASLLWVDILSRRIHKLNVESGAQSNFFLNGTVGCVGLTNKNRLIVAVGRSVGIFDPLLNIFERLISVEENFPRNRFNDGKCAPDGSFLVGSMDMDERSPNGALYRVSANFFPQTLLVDRTISNGLAWSPDMKKIYTIDTPTMVVMGYDYDPQSGNLTNPYQAFRIPNGIGHPDGMTSDTDGNLWIAMWGGAQVTVWDPIEGVLIGSLPVPCLNPTSCTFGGTGFDTLFITSAKVGLSEEQQIRYPHSGDLFALPLRDFRGLPGFVFEE